MRNLIQRSAHNIYGHDVLYVNDSDGPVVLIDYGQFVDPVLMEELLTIRYKYNSNDVKSIVSKDEMRKNNIKSPDRADALMMALYYTDRVFKERIQPNLPREAVMV